MPGRRYTKREKVTAVIAAEMTSAKAAERATGVPHQTILRWRDDPTMRIYLDKTRDELADDAKGLAGLAAEQIRRRIGEFEPRDLVMLYGVGTDKNLLLSGDATSRTETRDITGSLPDAAITDALRAANEAATGGGAAPATEEPPAG